MDDSKRQAPKLRFQDKVVIITGGSKGIGEGCVRVFVKNGAKAAFCATGVEAGKALEQEINQGGYPGEAFFVKCDVSKEDEVKNFINLTVERFGRIDCLINNAGKHPPHTTLFPRLSTYIDDISGDDFRELFEVNVIGYFLMSKYALPHLRQTKGSIINDSSLVGMIGQCGAVSYVATKGAISAMSRALAIDEAKYGVRVNTFSPGNVWTPLWDSLAQGSGNAEGMIKSGADSQLLGRFGTIEEAGEFVSVPGGRGHLLYRHRRPSVRGRRTQLRQ